MPEGPEVRLVTEWLHATFKNSIITKITCDIVKQGKAKQDKVKPNLPLLINGVTCKGKHIIFIWEFIETEYLYYSFEKSSKVLHLYGNSNLFSQLLHSI